MVHRTLTRRVAAGCLAVLAAMLLSAANTGPITKLTVAKDAAIVPLFDGMETGQFQVRIAPTDAHKSNVLIANTTAETLNVALPKAAVGVHVLPQLNGGFFNQQGNLFGNNQNQPGNNQNGAMNAITNLAQSVGGPMQPTGVLNIGSNQNTLPGNGFSSVPSEWAEKIDTSQYGGFAAVPPGKTIQLQMRTVCLNYGRPEPHSSLPYRLVSIEKYTTDPVLVELLETYSPRIDQQVMQATAWHVANNLNWDQIAQLPDRRLVGTSAKLFTVRQVQTAKSFLQEVEKEAAKRPTLQPAQVAAARDR